MISNALPEVWQEGYNQPAEALEGPECFKEFTDW